MLAGGFRWASILLDDTSDCLQRLTASWAMSSNITGCAVAVIKSNNNKRIENCRIAYLYEVVQLGQHPNGPLQSRIPRLLLIQRRKLEQPTNVLLLLDIKLRNRFPHSYSSHHSFRTHSHHMNQLKTNPHTYKLIWICQILRLGHIIPNLRLYHALCLEKQPRLCILQHHLEEVADVQFSEAVGFEVAEIEVGGEVSRREVVGVDVGKVGSRGLVGEGDVIEDHEGL